MELNKKQYESIIDLVSKVQTNSIDFNIFFKKVNEQLQNLEKNDQKQNIILTILESNYEIILSTGFIRELHNCYSQANIILVLNEGIKQFDNLLINNPYINEIVYVNLNINSILSLIRDCVEIAYDRFWNRNIDKAFSISWPGNIATLFFNWLIGAKECIGYGESIVKIYDDDNINDYMFDQLLTNNIINPEDLKSDILRKYYILEALGFDIQNKSLELFLDKQKDDRKIICVDISNGSPNWIFSIKKIAQFLLTVIDDNTYIMLRSNDLVNTRYFELLLTTNTYSDEEEKCINKDKIIKYDLNLMQNISLYIGNNTEVMHIASAYNKPIIAFFAEAEDKELNGMMSLYDRLIPYTWLDDPPAKILRPEFAIDLCVIKENIGGCTVPYPHCINEITLEQVEDAFNELFPEGLK